MAEIYTDYLLRVRTTAVQRWCECIKTEIITVNEHVQWCCDCSSLHPEDGDLHSYDCCGWAQDELGRRGWGVSTNILGRSNPSFPGYRCSVTIRKPLEDDGIYEGEALLDCFLAAIIATEPKLEHTLQEQVTE